MSQVWFKLSDEVLKLLPASSDEIAAQLKVDPRIIRSTLWNLKRKFLVKITDKKVPKSGKGRKCQIWERD